mmetsp:Transcript_46741/g.99717  ORF Transcript_46741/g.99717 Transcript_46741/m.99717 type:complete len:384 (-) Transcript_46741:262-1413(-)
MSPSTRENIADVGICGMVLERLVSRVETMETKVKKETEWNKTRKRKMEETGDIVSKRRTYGHEERSHFVKKFSKKNEDGGWKSMNQVVKEVKKVKGFEKFSRATAKRMRVAGPSRKRGRKVNVRFDQAELDQIIFTVIDEKAGLTAASARAVANVMYSHAVIVRAAKLACAMDEFKDDPKLQKAKFRRTWVRGFLKRNCLRKRRVTHIQKKDIPSDEDIAKRMAEIQAVVVEEEYSLHQTASVDETGIMYGAPPKQQYVPQDAVRGVAPPSDEKARFTAMEMGTADGKMQPSFHIIKCDSKTPNDLSQTRVIQKLHQEEGFREQDGWELKMWSRSLELVKKVKKQSVTYTASFRRPYLFHTENLRSRRSLRRSMCVSKTFHPM